MKILLLLWTWLRLLQPCDTPGTKWGLKKTQFHLTTQDADDTPAKVGLIHASTATVRTSSITTLGRYMQQRQRFLQFLSRVHHYERNEHVAATTPTIDATITSVAGTTTTFAATTTTGNGITTTANGTTTTVVASPQTPTATTTTTVTSTFTNQTTKKSTTTKKSPKEPSPASCRQEDGASLVTSWSNDQAWLMIDGTQ